MHRLTVGQRHAHRGARQRTAAVDDGTERRAQQAGHGVHAQRGAAHAQQVERTAVGAEQPAVAVDREDAFEQRADELHARMDVQTERVAEVVVQPVVLDHARRHLDQPHGVLVVAAPVARHVEHAQDVAARVEDGRGLAGQEVVGVHEVLVGMHQHRGLVDQRGAHAVGALRALGPVDAGRQRHLAGLFEEVFVADGVEDGALRVGQHDHALGLHDLVEQQFHHRRRVGEQAAVALAGDGEVGAAERCVVGRADAAQAQRGTALVGFVDRQHMLAVEGQGAGDRPLGRLFAAAAAGTRGGVHAGDRHRGLPFMPPSAASVPGGRRCLARRTDQRQIGRGTSHSL
ncbi:hypothetical protein X551_03373 [Methylibium sp. T29]|nr:hypothetical protein X551_03373 [Methylibium sp. T29]EWS58339.1 hypothetical protein Y694_03770 [Methylibium sp. T29-B]